MIDPALLESYGYGHEEIFEELEERIMNDVVRRIQAAEGVVTRTADFQLNQLKRLGYSDADIQAMLESTLNVSEEYVNSVYQSAIEADYVDNKVLYAAKGKSFIPFEKNTLLQNTIRDKARKTSQDMANMTRNLGFVIQEPGGKKAVRLSDFVNEVLNQAYIDINVGAFDYNTMLRTAVSQMSNSGVRWLNYESGWHNRITVASRRAVMSSINDMNRQIADQTAKDLETDMFEVDAHAHARPSHAEWQGGWFTKKELEETCGLGTVTGLMGVNCYHSYHPVIPGVSVPTYSKEQLDNWKNDEPVEYNGREYTGYEATQRMRRMETNMRATREKISLLKIGNGAEEDILALQARYRAQMNEYSRFAKKMGLKEQKERIYMDALGKQGSDKKKGLYNRSERSALTRYISGEAYILNGKLRSSQGNIETLDENDRRFVETIDRALDNSKNYRGTVYRTLDFHFDEDYRSFINEHKVGEIVTYPAYTSTSTTKSYDPETKVLLAIDSKHGKDIRAINSEEKEILYPRESSFLVKDYFVKDNQVIIFMEEA